MTRDEHDLIRTRDHARARAEHVEDGLLSVACSDRTAFYRPKARDHGNCDVPRCGCACHVPTDAERALWRQLADEIDAHLAARDDVEPTLFGGDA